MDPSHAEAQSECPAGGFTATPNCADLTQQKRHARAAIRSLMTFKRWTWHHHICGRLFACKICERSFPNPSGLWQHERERCKGNLLYLSLRRDCENCGAFIKGSTAAQHHWCGKKDRTDSVEHACIREMEMLGVILLDQAIYTVLKYGDAWSKLTYVLVSSGRGR